MKFLNLKIIRDYFYRLNSFQIFVLSFSICLLFYITEGILGIDRFYHPDSAHYLKKNYNFNLSKILSNPTYIFHKGYYVFSDLLNNNYYLLISANFVLYSFTNIMIYQKVFKNYFTSLTNLKSKLHPVDLPIQFFCISLTLSGHPDNLSRSFKSSSENFVILKNH